jgi:hypothetical protein
MAETGRRGQFRRSNSAKRLSRPKRHTKQFGFDALGVRVPACASFGVRRDDTGKQDGLTVGKLSNKRKAAAHGLDRFSASPAEDDRSAFRIERKSKAPDAIRCINAQFLHIRITRVLEGIRARPAQLRPNRSSNSMWATSWSCTSLSSSWNSRTKSSCKSTSHFT